MLEELRTSLTRGYLHRKGGGLVSVRAERRGSHRKPWSRGSGGLPAAPRTRLLCWLDSEGLSSNKRAATLRRHRGTGTEMPMAWPLASEAHPCQRQVCLVTHRSRTATSSGTLCPCAICGEPSQARGSCAECQPGVQRLVVC